MTECEKIIEKGFLPESFFQPETICDFYVDEKRKKIWAINLDLYQTFAHICDKYNLRYYAYAGTLLGAIRHHGFIPWDDDIDVCMPREDYEEFQRIALTELSEPYFLQTVSTDDNYFRTIIRLVNKNTTCLPVAFRHSNAINGIPLDIFPLDDCTPQTLQNELEDIRTLAIRCSSFMKRNDVSIMNEEQYERWKNSMTDTPRQDWEKVQNIARNTNSSDYYSMKVFVVADGRYNLPLRKSWFNSFKKINFVTINIQIPVGFESILETTYGDYMQFPPIEKRGMWHSGVIMDADKPYTEYM